MTLIEAIRASRMVRRQELAAPIELTQAVTNVKRAFPDLVTATPVSVGEAILRLDVALRNWDWEGVTVGNISLATRAFLDGDRIPDAVTYFLRKELEATTSSILLDAVAEAYFSGWTRHGERTRWLASILQARGSHLSFRWKRLFVAVPELLDTDEAPIRLAEKMLIQANPFQWLLDAGLASPHAGQLSTEAYLAWLKLLPPVMTNQHVERIFGWIRPRGHKPVSDDLAAKAVEKFLEPWRSDMPAPEFRTFLTDRIIEAFGDPRYESSAEAKAFWPLVAVDRRTILLRWLAGQSIDALLDIITKATGNHMWPTRHHFWKGLYDKGRVTEAWVALSRPAMDIALNIFSENGGKAGQAAALQTATGRKKETCLLIMKVGRYTVVEGSHDYRVHLFLSGDRRAPALYQDEYDAEDIMLPQGDRMTRIHDSYDAWQSWVEERVLR
ncbi:hypothetical protein FOB41_24050 [Agrobacterium pusense]|uniref:Zorya protein ZorC EH domain-containing protein n=1 Tax=Agrobacterium pusense TaxID=648995 RepID=A0A6H0ZTQ2_9HYPH|nr:hypothetical protein FOB41_24050 [Agrobacterium pusense]